MFKRTIAAVTILAAILCLGGNAKAVKPTQWLIYWYVCGTDIETTRIDFGIGKGIAYYKQWRFYDKNHRNWHAREQLPITGDSNTPTDMGSKEGLISFLRAGQKLEQELYPDGNVRRVLILKDHGSGVSVCKDEYKYHPRRRNEASFYRSSRRLDKSRRKTV